MHVLKYLVFLGILYSNYALANTYQGELEVLVVDNFEKNVSTMLFNLKKDGILYHLELPDSMDKNNLLSGSKVTIKGQELEGVHGKTIKVDSITIHANRTKNSLPPNEPTYDTRKMLPLLVNFANKKATDTVSMSDVDKILYTDTRSMKKNYQLASFNQLDFTRDVNGDGTPDIFVVNLNYNIEGCNYQQWARDARQAAGQLGINLSLYRHHMFILPQDISCDWGGIADFGCGATCSTWIRAYNPANNYSKVVYAHEVGHNLGMHHASTDLNNDGTMDSEYGDAACIMGTGDFQYFKELNAPHRDQMHWFDAYSNKIRTVSSGRYSIFPLENGTLAPGLLVVKVKKNDKETYYFSYRKNIGPFGAGADSYLNKVNVHRVVAGDPHTYFLRTIGSFESFIDAVNKVKVTVIATGTSSAIIEVNR